MADLDAEMRAGIAWRLVAVAAPLDDIDALVTLVVGVSGRLGASALPRARFCLGCLAEGRSVALRRTPPLCGTRETCAGMAPLLHNACAGMAPLLLHGARVGMAPPLLSAHTGCPVLHGARVGMAPPLPSSHTGCPVAAWRRRACRRGGAA